jgi:hypothetical protein
MSERARISPWERAGLWGLVGVIVFFGCFTVYRSAFLSRRMGDSRMMFRAAWMARSGGDLYARQDEYLLHYNYPPLLACLMIPLADPPAGTVAVAIPFPALVGVWYVINTGFLLVGIHLFALAVAPGDPAGSRRWWALRVTPFLVCLPAIGSTMMQGQVTPLLFILIAWSAYLAGRGQGVMSGLMITAAACIKLFPALLFLWPLWQFGRRAMRGALVACAGGLIVIPTIAMGPAKAIEAYHTLYRAMILPALGQPGDDSRHKELFSTNGPHSMSLQSTINNLLHPDRKSRPDRPSPVARYSALAASAALLAVTIWAFRKQPPAESQPLFHGLAWGALTLVMLLACPVTHLHYLMLALPAVLALVAASRGDGIAPSPLVTLALAVHVATVVLAQLPGLEALKDKCLPVVGLLLLWAASCLEGARLTWRQQAEEVRPLARAA